MKKIFSIVSVFLLTLSGCGSDDVGQYDKSSCHNAQSIQDSVDMSEYNYSQYYTVGIDEVTVVNYDSIEFVYIINRSYGGYSCNASFSIIENQKSGDSDLEWIQA